MTKLETMKCEKLMDEAIEYAIDARDKLAVAEKHPDATERYVLENMAHNHRGYAEGINQALAVIGFKHNRMKELGKLIS